MSRVLSSDQWAGAVSYQEDLDAAVFQTGSKTFYNTPGSVAEFLAWTGGLEEGNRGIPLTREGPVSFELSGTEECMKNLSHILVAQTQRAINRLGVNCEIILANSQKEVPVDMTYETRMVMVALDVPASSRWYGNVGTKSYVQRKRRGRMKGGYLKSTGTVEPLTDGTTGFQIGYNAPYAEIQHEDMTFRHTRPGAKAKYLEDPIMARLPLIAEDIANYCRGFMS
nr:hypothetical protein [uncultured Methanoregula sp.]